MDKTIIMICNPTFLSESARENNVKLLKYKTAKIKDNTKPPKTPA